MKSLKGFIKTYLSPYPIRPERRPAPEFVAYHGVGSTPKLETIKDISSTGIYLVTEERWLPGTVLPLTLQRKGPLEEDADSRVTLQARIVRWGEDGVGFSFALPKDLDFRLWESLLESAADQTNLDDILGPFRMAQALAFLTRICPSVAEEVRQLVRKGLGNLRVANAVEIALKAETLLESEPDADRMRADAQTVLRIIEDGSWADEDWIRQLWAGLLATSCTVDKRDESAPVLVDRFSQFAPVHVRIFDAACTRATKILLKTGTVSSKPLIFEVEDIQKITGSQSVAKIERDIHHLSELGVLEESVRSRSLLLPEEANITPSSLGLKLYVRCNGYRGLPQDFFHLVP